VWLHPLLYVTVECSCNNSILLISSVENRYLVLAQCTYVVLDEVRQNHNSLWDMHMYSPISSAQADYLYVDYPVPCLGGWASLLIAKFGSAVSSLHRRTE